MNALVVSLTPRLLLQRICRAQFDRGSRPCLTAPAFLNGLSLLLVLAAVLVPLGLKAPDMFMPRPDLHWTTMDRFFPPGQSSEEIRARYGWGHSILLANEGDGPTGEVRVLLDYVPEHVDVRAVNFDDPIMGPAPGRYSEEGYEVRLGSLEPGQRVGLRVYRAPFDMVTVYEDEARVWEDFQNPSDFTPRTWFPDWAIYGGTLLIASLVLRIRALQRRVREADRAAWSVPSRSGRPGAA
jgi:hypothetical protein